MNEINLKEIWKSDDAAPQFDYTNLQKSLNRWHDKLSRQVKIEIWLQIAAVVLPFVAALYDPRLLLFAVFGFFLGIWYIPELRKLYRRADEQAGGVRQILTAKIATMESFFRRTRIVMYVATPLALPFALQSFDGNRAAEMSLTARIIFEAARLIIFEVLIIIATEIYFSKLYKPALDELKELSEELNAPE